MSRPLFCITGQRIDAPNATATIAALAEQSARSGPVAVECVAGVFFALASAARERSDTFGPLSVRTDGPIVQAVFGFENDHPEPAS